MAEKEHVCTGCGSITEREMLTVKKVLFQEIGLNPLTIRSRNVAWLCPRCVARDEDWRWEAYAREPLKRGSRGRHK